MFKPNTALCPKCGSSAIRPDPKDAGKNVCVGCRYVGPVREFHAPRLVVISTEPRRKFWWQDE